MNNHSCTSFEAAAAWEYRRAPFDEPILILNLDTASAGVCEPASDGLPKEIWNCHSDAPATPFFLAAAQQLFPDAEDSEAAANALYEKAPQWSRTLRTYLLNSSEDFPLDPIVIGDRTLTPSCAQLMGIFDTHYRPGIEACLNQAHPHRTSDAMRILPIGALARFYPAEHLIRQQFYSRIQLRLPVLPGLVSWNDHDNPADVIAQGIQLHQQLTASAQVLANTWTLQVQHRIGDRLIPEFLTLAEKGTPLSTLNNVTYSATLLAISREPLCVYADSTPYRVRIPATVFSDPGRPEKIQVRLGLVRETPALFIRCGSRTVQICPEAAN